jgi:uncharacterized protein (TIRG00374 family)
MIQRSGAQMAVALRAADLRWIGAAMLIYFVVEIAAALRWHVLLKVQGIELGLPRVGALFLIGVFFNQFLPGGTGRRHREVIPAREGDTGRMTGALLAVLFDRLIGLVALITITGTLIALRYDFLSQKPRLARCSGRCSRSSGSPSRR